MFIISNGSWEQIGTITATANTIHTWDLTETQRDGISGDVYIAFFSIKTGSYSGTYNATTTPYLLNPENANSYLKNTLRVQV